jgi:hypothetical protein
MKQGSIELDTDKINGKHNLFGMIICWLIIFKAIIPVLFSVLIGYNVTISVTKENKNAQR